MSEARPSNPWIVTVAYTDLPSDARVVREAAEALARGARLTLVVPRSDGRLTNPAGLERAEIVWLPVLQQRGRTTLSGQLAFIRELIRWRRGIYRVPDVLHIHNMPDYLYWALHPWQRAGAKVVLDVHDIMSDVALHRFGGVKRHVVSWALRRLERTVWRRVDHLITVHDEYRERIADAAGTSNRVSVVLNTPDPNVVRPEVRRSPDNSRFKIVFHGSVTERSGILQAVRALPHVIERVPSAHLLIVGSGSASTAVRRTIESLSLQERVSFADRYVPLDEVIEWIADADVGIVPTEPSRFTSLMLPVKLLEYAVLGIPAVATRLPLIERYLGEESVHLVDHPDPMLLADGLVELARDAEYREGLVSHLSAFAERHQWTRYADVLAGALDLHR